MEKLVRVGRLKAILDQLSDDYLLMTLPTRNIGVYDTDGTQVGYIELNNRDDDPEMQWFSDE